MTKWGNIRSGGWSGWTKRVNFGAHSTEPAEYTGSFTPIDNYQIDNRAAKGVSYGN